MRDQIRELSEKLAFAHETIAIMEEEHRRKQPQTSEPASDQEDDEEAPDKISEGSNPSAKMVDRMISQAQRKIGGKGFSGIQKSLSGI